MNQTWKVMKSRQHRFDCSNLWPSTKYKISILSKNGEIDGGETSIEGLTRLKFPDPKPDPPLITGKTDKTAKIKIPRYKTNNNGPITKYLVVVSLMESDFVKNDFNELLLTTYEKAKDEGISYYIAAEIDAETFLEETKTFTIGDNRMYGKYFNAPLPTKHFGVLIGIVSRLNEEEKTTFSNISHENIAEVVQNESSSNNFLIYLLTIACLLCGFILLGSVVFYAYIRIMRLNLRNNRFERHELQVTQGPILEVDNNGFISCDFDVSGVGFKEKLEDVLSHLEPNQKITRKNLSLDIDAILGIGDWGDVIKGQLNSQNLVHQNDNQTRFKLAQVHVVSADDMDHLIQVKFLRELQNLLQFGQSHTNILQFFGICKTHDWIFIVCEDTPENLKQFLLSYRADEQNLAGQDNRLSSFNEEHALRLMSELANAMTFLKYNKVVHKNLNSNNIRVKRQNSTSPSSLSLSIFGPTLYKVSQDGSKSLIDDERWFSIESFRFQKFSHASDVYSCALAIWEIACIGATPYQKIPTRDLFVRIKKGVRPEKYSFISEDLYQLLLNCWAEDPLERLDFTEIVGQLKNFLHSPHYYLNYTLEGPLPFYLPSLEIKN
jgi:endothelial-specific receptor tyrosine kinase